MTARERGYLLLCAELGQAPAPLTLAQLRQLRQRVREAGPPAEPSRELTADDLRGLGYEPAQAERIAALLGREAALDAYLKAGREHDIEALTPAGAGYPPLLRARLGDQTPPVLFLRGEQSLLKKQAVCLVGSRRLEPLGRAFAERVGALAAKEGYVLVSGNASGADSAAQAACLARGGSVIAVLADSPAYHVPPPRTLYLCEDGWHLPFSAQRALRRNRIIHALAQKSFVAQTDYGVGGTWSGSMDALRRGVQVFVHADGSEGARELILRGATPVSLDGLDSLSSLLPRQLIFS